MALKNYAGGVITGTGDTIDLGGKTYTAPISISNFNSGVIQNFNFSGGGKFVFTGACKGVVIKNGKARTVGHVIDSGWKSINVDGLELDSIDVDGASGYAFHFVGFKNLNIHHIKVVNKAQGGDGAHPCVFFLDNAGGNCQIHHCFVQKSYGGLTRIWGAPGSSHKVYNCVVIDGLHYSAVEANGHYYGYDFDVEIYNCVFGNLAADGYESAACVAYDAPNVINLHDNIIYGTSNGEVQSDSEPIQKSNNKLSGSGILLPDASNWNDGLTTSLPVPIDGKPTADAGKDIVLIMPTNSVVFDAIGKDVEGPVTYLWRKISGTGIMENPNVEDLRVINLGLGESLYELEVTDSKNQKTLDQVKVTVNAAPSPTPTKTLSAVQASIVDGKLTATHTLSDGTKAVYQ